jgi:DNA-binding Xre family transcriptional regulator
MGTSDTNQPGGGAGITGLDWRLHAVMADRGIKFAKDLQDALARDGYPVSASSVSRLVYQTPKQLDIRLLSSLCRVLACTPDELLVPRGGIGRLHF